jgi:hypothetical protein
MTARVESGCEVRSKTECDDELRCAEECVDVN